MWGPVKEEYLPGTKGKKLGVKRRAGRQIRQAAFGYWKFATRGDESGSTCRNEATELAKEARLTRAEKIATAGNERPRFSIYALLCNKISYPIAGKRSIPYHSDTLIQRTFPLVLLI